MQRSYLELPRALLRAGVTLGLTLLAASELHAATVVALGASQTQGKGVSREDAFPAQLKALLKSKGIDVTVRNAGKTATRHTICCVDSTISLTPIHRSSFCSQAQTTRGKVVATRQRPMSVPWCRNSGHDIFGS